MWTRFSRHSIAPTTASRAMGVARRQLSSSATPPATITALRDLLGDRFSTANAIREQHGRDESYHAVAPPDAVAFVQSTEEVSQVLKICAATCTPVIPFGAGSSLEGHISATHGGVSLDLMAMNSILHVEPENMSCRVQAGVTREQLNTDLRATGLFFPVDPGANASLGGMVSTNASGTTTVRYGNMKTNVLGLTAVLPDGRIIKTGSKARKSSAGYDLTRLLIGSEGTLAVVTEAELRLYGIPEAEKTMICSFSTIKDAVDACATVMQMGIPVARMELMDENAVNAINQYSKLHNAVQPSLIIEHHGTPGELEEQSALVQDIVADFNAQDVQLASSLEDRKKLWSGRHSAWWATINQMPGSRALSTDVCVPISKLTDVIVDTQEDLRRSELFGTIVGHVGDGNFHVMIPFMSDNEEHMKKVKAFSTRLVMRALAAEGTCTGEHGIGDGKMDYLLLEHGDSVDVMRAIKNAIDPLNIMNPGKIFARKSQDDVGVAATDITILPEGQEDEHARLEKNMPAAQMAASAVEAVAAIATSVVSVSESAPVATTTATTTTASTTATAAGVSPLSAAAMESVRRRGLQLTSEFHQFVSAISSRKDAPAVNIPLEFKLLAGLLLLFLFLLFLIAVLWDRYGKEISELYTPNGASGGSGHDMNDGNSNDVADEYTVYQKLPTFFYEYMPKKRN